MKRAVTIILAAFLMICLFPMSASAEEALKAPTVQYKLINHDEIALRWTEVEGADGYCVYRTDVETGKTVRYTEYIRNTTYDITGLKASTDYIFKVAAVSENDGQITFGKKSKGTALTTPDEWYYFQRLEYDSSKRKYKTVIECRHYNKTGMKIYNWHPLQNQFHKDNPNCKMEWNKIFQDHGYVYFELGGMYGSPHSSAYYLHRIKNDGSDLNKITGIFSNSEKKYDIVTNGKNEYVYDFDNAIAKNLTGDWAEYDYVKEQFNNYKTNPNDSWIVNYAYSSAHVRCYDGNSGVDNNCILIEEDCYFSGPAYDGKYVYFMSHPLYNITDKTASVVYRCNPDGSDLQSIMCIPKDMSFIYGDPNNGSIDLFYCDGEYLYNCVYGRMVSEENKDNYYTFYRIRLDDKRAMITHFHNLT